MVFTVELDQIVQLFRLQKDGSWRECTRDRSLQDSDLTCDTAYEVTERSATKGTLEIKGIVYDIDPDQWPTENEQLHHSSSVFRRDYPREPTLAQLKSTIATGDDSVNNSLILNVHGKFELRQSPPFNQLINDPSIVVRHETFIRGNEYVGPEAAAHETLMHDLFVSSLEHWKNHIKYHITQEYSDTPAGETLEQIQKKLEELQENWQADY